MSHRAKVRARIAAEYDELDRCEARARDLGRWLAGLGDEEDWK